mgnify:CR=1 FL=1
MKSKLATLKTMAMMNESDYILGNITEEEYKLNLININEKLKEIEEQNEQKRNIKNTSSN